MFRELSRPSRMLLLFVAMTTGLAVAPAPATAAPSVRCGDTITTSVTLTRNLRCSGDGLTIGADGITVNLNQHTISGSGTGKGITATERRDLIVRNGTIKEFQVGVHLSLTNGVTVRSLRLLRNGISGQSGSAGLFAEHVTGLTVRGGEVVARGRTSAIVADDASSVVVVDGVKITNGSLHVALGTEDVYVFNSTFRNSALDLYDAFAVTAVSNTFIGSWIALSEASGVWIAENDITGGGISMFIANNVSVRRNTIRSAESAVWVDTTSSHIKIKDNEIIDNQYGVYAKIQTLAESDALTILDNTFSGNGGAGVFIEAEHLGSPRFGLHVGRNVFRANGFTGTDTDAAGRRINDGLHVNVPVGSPLRIYGNRAEGNADFGIEALPAGSVQDGGRNTSTGDPNGCAGVVCARP